MVVRTAGVAAKTVVVVERGAVEVEKTVVVVVARDGRYGSQHTQDVIPSISRGVRV